MHIRYSFKNRVVRYLHDQIICFFQTHNLNEFEYGLKKTLEFYSTYLLKNICTHL